MTTKTRTCNLKTGEILSVKVGGHAALLIRVVADQYGEPQLEMSMRGTDVGFDYRDDVQRKLLHDYHYAIDVK